MADINKEENERLEKLNNTENLLEEHKDIG